MGYDHRRYKLERLIRTYPPKYVKQVIVAIAENSATIDGTRTRSISEVTSIILQDYVDRIPKDERERILKQHRDCPPPSGSKHQY